MNAKDNKGRTALMIASENGHTEIVQLLKAHGAKEYGGGSSSICVPRLEPGNEI